MPESKPPEIRPARAEEAEAVVTLIHRAFGQYRGQLQPDSSALSETAESIRSLMASGTILVALQDGRMVGCVSVQRKPEFAYAGRLAVDPSARGTGVGRALMGNAESVARQMGARRLRVDVRLALAENRAFFQSLGFAEGVWRCHPGFAHPTYVELEKILV
jgi:predicted N-acetyltransferase YhbS